VAVLSAFALALIVPSSSSGALLDIRVKDTVYDPDDATFDFLDIDNPNIVWTWGDFNGDQTVAPHDVIQQKGMFKSGKPKRKGQYELEASGGTYKYYCSVHPDVMKATVGIRPSLEFQGDNALKLIWANKFTQTGKRFDVRYRTDLGKWKVWLKHTKKTRKVFGKSDKPVHVDTTTHGYEFEARTYKGKPSKERRSSWSPAASTV
jgi:plastocyanin